MNSASNMDWPPKLIEDFSSAIAQTMGNWFIQGMKPIDYDFPPLEDLEEENLTSMLDLDKDPY